jgi:predicted transposase YbfD/YdcC
MKNNNLQFIKLISIEELKQYFNNDKSLIKYLNKLTDKRSNTHLVKYSLTDIVFQTILSYMSNCISYRENTHFGECNFTKAPSLTTLTRLLKIVDTVELNSLLQEWTKSIYIKLGIDISKLVHITVDGKILRNYTQSNFGSKEENAITLVTAFCSELRLSIASLVFQTKEKVKDGKDLLTEKVYSESEAFRDLVEGISKDICIDLVSGDALHLSEKTLTLLKEKNLDYLLSVKNNTPLFFKELEIQKVLVSSLTFELSPTVTKIVKVYSIPIEFKTNPCGNRFNWSNLNINTYIVVTTLDKRKRKLTIKQKTKIRYSKIDSKTRGSRYKEDNSSENYTKHYVSSLISLNYTPREFEQKIRDHWSIENHLHRERDVVFGEDYKKSKNVTLIKNTSTILTTIMNIFSSHQYKSMKQIVKYATNRIDFCLDLLGAER